MNFLEMRVFEYSTKARGNQIIDQIFKSSNTQIFKSSNLQILKSSNLQILKKNLIHNALSRKRSFIEKQNPLKTK